MKIIITVWLWSMFIGWLSGTFLECVGIEFGSLLFWIFLFLITFLNTNFVYYFFAQIKN